MLRLARPVATMGQRSLLTRALSSAAPLPLDAEAAAQQAMQAARPVEEIPGPRCYPLIGCLPTMMKLNLKEVHKFFNGLSDQYGPIFRLVNPGAPPMVFVVDADASRKLNHLTQADPHRPALDSLKLLREKDKENFFQGKTGMMLENGEEWWRIRSRVQTPMMKPKLVSMYLEKMDQVALDFLDRIASLQAELGEMPSTFQTELYKWALESVCLVATNQRLGCLDPKLPSDSTPMKMINTVNSVFITLTKLEFGPRLWQIMPTPSFKRLQEGQAEFLSMLLPTILDAEAQLKNVALPEDEMPLLETLLLTSGLSRHDVVTFMLDLFFAGIDTTSHTVAFALYLLAKNPEAQACLQKEVDMHIGSQTDPLTQQQLAKLVYLKAVVKETLRVFPLTGGFARTLKEDTVIRGFKIPAGYVVIPLTMLTSWQDSHFTKASKFLPERWLRDRPLGYIHPHASLPFGVGPRMCVGRRIAEQEMYTLLARVAQRYMVDYKYEDIGIESHILFRPSKPLRFTFKERH